MRKILLLFLFLFFAFTLILTPPPAYAELIKCSGADTPAIPISVSPSEGDNNQTFIVTVKFGELKQDERDYYRNNTGGTFSILLTDGLDSTVSTDPPIPPVSISDSDKQQGFSNPFTSGSKDLFIHLEINGCKIDSPTKSQNKITFKDTGSNDPIPSGGYCDPAKQAVGSEPRFICISGTSCLETLDANNAITHKCLAPPGRGQQCQGRKQGEAGYKCTEFACLILDRDFGICGYEVKKGAVCNPDLNYERCEAGTICDKTKKICVDASESNACFYCPRGTDFSAITNMCSALGAADITPVEQHCGAGRCVPGDGCKPVDIVLLSAPCPPAQRDSNGDCKKGATIFTAFGGISIDVPGFTKWLLTIVLSVAGIIVIFIIIATGYRMMVSQGDPEKVKEAREALTAAVVGLLFIIFSLVILQFITVDILHIPGFNR